DVSEKLDSVNEKQIEESATISTDADAKEIETPAVTEEPVISANEATAPVDDVKETPNALEEIAQEVVEDEVIEDSTKSVDEGSQDITTLDDSKNNDTEVTDETADEVSAGVTPMTSQSVLELDDENETLVLNSDIDSTSSGENDEERDDEDDGRYYDVI
ncbi:Hypothetical predicted protein, partial [Olea europaea subsp. europaea]